MIANLNLTHAQKFGRIPFISLTDHPEKVIDRQADTKGASDESNRRACEKEAANHILLLRYSPSVGCYGLLFPPSQRKPLFYVAPDKWAVLFFRSFQSPYKRMPQVLTAPTASLTST